MIDHYRHAITELRLAAISAPLAMMATAFACSSGAVSPTPDIDVPDGWTREEARSGLIGRDIEYWDLGFTVDLPAGWIVEEVWPNGDHPTGILIGDQDNDRSAKQQLFYVIGVESEVERRTLSQDPRYRTWQEEIGGVTATFYAAAEDANQERLDFGVHFERLPGTVPLSGAPSLSIQARGNRVDDPELAFQMFRTVRYVEQYALPELPEAQVTPRPDWPTRSAREDPSFTLRLPPGWSVTESIGIDTVIGTFEGDGIRILYDHGNAAGGPVGPGDPEANSGDVPPHTFWEERIEGEIFRFTKPRSGDPNPEATTGAFIPIQPGSSSTDRHLGIWASGLDGRQQETVLAIIRTIRDAGFAESD